MEVQIQAEKKDHSFFFLLINQIQCLITALKAESVPFIQHFKLKRDDTFDFPFFINHETNIALVGVGVGSKNIGVKDELYQTAVEIIKSEGKASTSFLQRKLQIGYNRAARIIDMMEEEGIVSKANHVGKRDVL